MNEILSNKLKYLLSHKEEKELLNQFLGTYYSDYIIGGGWRSETDEYPEELRQDLEDRESGVFDAMNCLMEKGCDPNEGEDEAPLEYAVAYADASMTKYLIDHGANPAYWPWMDETPEEIRSNYYLDDLDIAYYNEAWPITRNFVDALLQTAKVLSADGGLGDYGGLCLLVDNKIGEITIGSPHYLY